MELSPLSLSWETQSHLVCLWILQSVGATVAHVNHGGAPAAFLRLSFVNPIKGELGSEIRFCCVHNIHFIKLRHLREEEITDFGLWAVVGQKPHLSLGCCPK